MIALMIFLRWVHIVSGIMWVGAAVMLTFFISPAVLATEESGQKFMGYLMQNTTISKFIYSVALMTVAAGIILYGIDSNWFTSPWMSSGPGLGFGLGGVAGLIGLYYGIMQNLRSKALIGLGQTIQGQGAPPTAEQQAQLQALQAKLKSGGMLNAIFLLIGSILMATARYWIF
jgi:uncharacterized membrane protein